MKNSNLFSSVVIKWGLIYGLIGVIYVFLFAMLDLQAQGSIFIGIADWVLKVVLAFLIYFLATKEYRGENGNLISFGRGFGINMLVGLIGGVIRGVGFYIYAKFIDPSYIQNMMEAQLEAQEQLGGGSAPTAELPGYMEFILTPEFYAVIYLILVIWGAVIFGLIVAAVNQKKEEFNY